jgi:hypothetical protein
VRHPARQRQLLASLTESGQQTPIVVVAAPGQADRFVWSWMASSGFWRWSNDGIVIPRSTTAQRRLCRRC